MIALRVTLNGQLLCTAGAEDLSVLNSMVAASGSLGPLTKDRREEAPDLWLSVGGLTGRIAASDEHLRWTEHQLLNVGDRVEIEILDTLQVDRPQETRPLNVERQKEKQRERFIQAREIYHALRQEFEPAEE